MKKEKVELTKKGRGRAGSSRRSKPSGKNKLKYLAGCELGAGTFINDTLPEEKAAELRSLILEE